MANKAPVWYLPGPFTRYNEDVKALAQKSGVRIVDARFAVSYTHLTLPTPPYV